MHSDEEEVVADVVEVGDAAVFFAEVGAGDGDVGDGGFGPGEVDGGLGVEVEAAGPACFGEGVDEGGGGVGAHAEEDVADAPAEGLDGDEGVGDFAAAEAGFGGVFIEGGLAEDAGLGVLFDGGEEVFDAEVGVLAVGVHGDDVGVAEVAGDDGSFEDGGAFAAVFGDGVEGEVVVSLEEWLEVLGGLVGGAVGDDDGVEAGAEGGGDGAVEEGAAGVVAGDEDGGVHERAVW